MRRSRRLAGDGRALRVRITYVLERPELGGGTKVVFQHAELLRRLGHQVTVLADGPRPPWIDGAVPYVDRSAEPLRLPEQDLVVGTYWTTLEVARELALGPVAHFCQGYEGGLAHLRPRRQEIETVYRRSFPTLVVSPHLGDLLAERFGRSFRVVPPVVDPRFRPRFRLRPRRAPLVAVSGIFEAEVKGIPTALEAIRLLRRRGIPARVLRISVLPLGPEEEAILPPDEFLCHVPPASVAAALARCDLLLFPSRAEEGFGLPVLEAFAARVPVVASDIPSVRGFAAAAAELVPADDPEAFADRAEHLLTGALRWHAARRAGSRVTRRFRPERVAPRLDAAVRWAAAAAVEAR